MRVEIRSTREKQRTAESTPASTTTSSSRKSSSRYYNYDFKSVLARPFSLWNRIEEIIAEFLPEWSGNQRSIIIQNVIRFLELKIILEDYRTSNLLSPTQLIAHAWHVIILETELYRDVTLAIQKFHGRPHRMIHHRLLRRSEKKAYEERLERTQRLFKFYYGCEMPSSLKEIDVLPLRNLRDQRKSRGGVDSSIVSARDDEITSWINDREDRGRDGDEYDDDEENIPWYFPWIPGCDCFGMFGGEGYCSKEDILFEDDIYAVKEDVSLLTPPGSLPDE
jgi:hypothetical protein